jgi:hypothetical protein
MGICNRAVTHVAQNSTHCSIIMEDFVSYIRQGIKRHGILPGNVVNGDETNCDWAMPPKKNFGKKGKKSVEAKGATSSARSTVLLCVTASGLKLDPFLIFTGSKKGPIRMKELQALVGYPKGIQYTTQGKAWMDEATMLEWVEVVWKPFTQSRPGLFLLILDEARAHMTANVVKSISNCKTILEIIPGGYTSKLQVLDVGINRPFKHYYEDQSEQFVRKWTYQHPPGEKAKPTRQNVAHWVWNSWNSIKEDSILNTWQHCGYIDRNSN